MVVSASARSTHHGGCLSNAADAWDPVGSKDGFTGYKSNSEAVARSQTSKAKRAFPRFHSSSVALD